MPKIRSYTPHWLTEPAVGHNLFTQPEADPKASTFSPYASKKRSEPGPRKTIARRGTEVFVANGKELKWGDLVYLKDAWESKQRNRNQGTQIKREDSQGSFESADDGTGEDSYLADGYRVSVNPYQDALGVSLLTQTGIRQSRRLWQTIFGSLSCLPWRTTWPS